MMVTTSMGGNGWFTFVQVLNIGIVLATLVLCVLGIILAVLGIKALRIYIRKNRGKTDASVDAFSQNQQAEDKGENNRGE